jgi:hypothetical protein
LLLGICCLLLLFLRLLFVSPAALAYASEQGPGTRPDRRTFPHVAADGTTDDADQRAARGSPHHTAFRFRAGSRGPGAGGVKAGLLNGPDVALALIGLLLLWRLAFGRVIIRLLRRRGERQ